MKVGEAILHAFSTNDAKLMGQVSDFCRVRFNFNAKEMREFAQKIVGSTLTDEK